MDPNTSVPNVGPEQAPRPTQPERVPASSGPEQAPKGPERSPERAPAAPERAQPAQPAAPQPMQPAPGPVTPAPATPAASDDDDTPLIADDVDVIEMEWVNKAKKVIHDTKDDPHAQEAAVEKLQKDYLKKRYGKDLKLPGGA